MKALILGGGYGTRLKKGLEDLTPELREKYGGAIEGRPKPLVLVAGKPLIEYLLEKIERETPIKEVYIVTNDFYYGAFEKWLMDYSSSLSIEVFNDGSKTNEDRLGWVADINFAVNEAEVNEDLFVLAGDTLFEMDFGNLVDYFEEKQKDVLSVYEEDWSVLHRRGIVVVDDTNKVVDFLEKPTNPPTNLAAPIAYVLTKETVKRIPGFLNDNYNKEDNLIERIVKSGENEIYAFRFEKRYDIGNIADLIYVDEEFSRRLKK